MTKKTHFTNPEVEKLAQQRIHGPPEVEVESAPAKDHRIIVYKTIDKRYQRVTEGLSMRIPTDVLEFIEANVLDRNDRITAMYHCLELGAEVLREKLKTGDVIIRYDRDGGG